MSGPILTAGECILCQMCGNAIAYAAVDLTRGMFLDASLFKVIPPQMPIENGTRPRSTCCKETWFQDGLIYTKRGWV